MKEPNRQAKHENAQQILASLSALPGESLVALPMKNIIRTGVDITNRRPWQWKKAAGGAAAAAGDVPKAELAGAHVGPRGSSLVLLTRLAFVAHVGPRGSSLVLLTRLAFVWIFVFLLELSLQLLLPNAFEPEAGHLCQPGAAGFSKQELPH